MDAVKPVQHDFSDKAANLSGANGKVPKWIEMKKQAGTWQGSDSPDHKFAMSQKPPYTK